jgi:hypothetical protein
VSDQQSGRARPGGPDRWGDAETTQVQGWDARGWDPATPGPGAPAPGTPTAPSTRAAAGWGPSESSGWNPPAPGQGAWPPAPSTPPRQALGTPYAAAPGPVAPPAVAPGSVAPGSVAPGPVAPPAVVPDSIAPQAAPAGSAPGWVPAAVTSGPRLGATFRPLGERRSAQAPVVIEGPRHLSYSWEAPVGVDRTVPDRRRGLYWLLLIPGVMPLLVPLYNRMEPRLFGLPFFYWYQLACVLLTIGIMTAVHQLTKGRRQRWGR